MDTLVKKVGKKVDRDLAPPFTEGNQAARLACKGQILTKLRL